MKISIITPTGGRPLAFAMCEKYMRNQTFKDNIQWIVVDDGEIPTQMNLNQEYIRSDIIWKEGLNTQAYNLLLGLEKVKNDILFFIEDDDWYSPNFIQSIIDSLLKIENTDMIGEANSLNYNLLTNEYYLFEMNNMASLYKTCITKKVYPFFKKLLLFYHKNNTELIGRKIFIDQILWTSNFNKHLIENNNLAIGIKNMPGRKGVCGHTNDWSRSLKYIDSKTHGIDSKNLDFLKQKIGEKDFSHYFNVTNSPKDSIPYVNDLFHKIKISIITPTGGRPLAFAMCEKWMKRQTLQPDEWVVIDDYEEPTKCTMGQKIIRRQPFWQPGEMTLQKNLLEALKVVTGDIVLIIEDDDWYHTNYIENMTKEFERLSKGKPISNSSLMIGQGCSIYFNVQNHSYQFFTNMNHASLFQTGFTKDLIPQVNDLLAKHQDKIYFDQNLWGELKNCHKIIFPVDSQWSIGIKGLTGKRYAKTYGHSELLTHQGKEYLGLFQKIMPEEDFQIYINISGYLLINKIISEYNS